MCQRDAKSSVGSRLPLGLQASTAFRVCILIFALASTRALAGPGDSYDIKNMPEAWKAFHTQPRLPSAAETLTVEHLILPPSDTTVEVPVGDRLLLSPQAETKGWRLEFAEVDKGVLWPVPGEPFVFIARCPGHAMFDWEGPPGQGWHARTEVRVASGKLNVVGCKQSQAAPTLRCPKKVTLDYAGWVLLLHPKDEFALAAPTLCPFLWNRYRISKSHVVDPVRSEEKGGPSFVASSVGETELFVRGFRDCVHYSAGASVPNIAPTLREARGQFSFTFSVIEDGEQ